MSGHLKTAAFVKTVLHDFFATSGLESTLFTKSLTVTSASPGEVDLALRIQKEHLNRLKILHGGTIASLVDLGGSLAVASNGLYNTGVSTDINVTYLRGGGKELDDINIKAVCDKLGSTIAFTNISFYNKSGHLFARGSHTKHIAQALERQQGRFFEIPEATTKPEQEGQGKK